MYWGSLYNTYWRVASKKKNSNFTMSVDVFLLINLHRNTALPARLPSSGRAPRTSCVIPEPRLPKLHSCVPTDPDSIRLPSSVLTAPLGLSYSAVVPKGAFSIRDQPQPPNPLVSTLGSKWRGAQARWLNVHGQFSSVLTGTAPLRLMYCCTPPLSPQGCFFHPRPTSTPEPSGLHPWFQLVPYSSTQARLLNTNQESTS